MEESFSIDSQGEAGCRIRGYQWNMLTHVRGFLMEDLLPLLSPRADNPVYGADRGDIAFVAYTFLEQPVPDLPGKDGGVFLLVVLNFRDDVWRGNFWLASTYHTRLDGTSLVIPAMRKGHYS